VLYREFGYFYDFVNGVVEKLDTVLDPDFKNEMNLLLDAMCKLQYEQGEQDMAQEPLLPILRLSSPRALGGCSYMVYLTDLKQPPTGIS